MLWRTAYVLPVGSLRTPEELSAFDERLALLADLEYADVELSFKAAEDLDLEAVRTLLTQRGLGVSALATGRIASEDGLDFASPSPARRRAAIRRVEGHLRAAARLAAPIVFGVIRGTVPPGERTQTAYHRVLDCLGECLALARQLGAAALLEPLNRYETSFIHTLAEGAAAITELGSERLGLLADTYHMNIEEAQPADSLAACAPFLRHVHFADNNRQAPGMGHLDFRLYCDTLSKLGYSGRIAIEVLPLPSEAEAARRSAEFMRKLCASRGPAY